MAADQTATGSFSKRRLASAQKDFPVMRFAKNFI
jgi:hypothetical protein